MKFSEILEALEKGGTIRHSWGNSGSYEDIKLLQGPGLCALATLYKDEKTPFLKSEITLNYTHQYKILDENIESNEDC